MTGMLSTVLLYIVPFLIVLGVVVTVHEMGHFLAARWLGTAVDRFSIGFGPALANFRDKSGVEWRIGLLPLGGYVRFAGDDNAASVPDCEDLETLRKEVLAREGPAALRTYFHFKPLWQRAIIVAAGPIANFLLAIVVFAALLMAVGEPAATSRVQQVFPNTPAERAGFRAGDVILAVNGHRLQHPDEAKRIIILRTGEPIDFLVQRQGAELHLTGTPERGEVTDVLGKTHRLGRMGLQFDDSDQHMRRFGPVAALVGGVERSRDVVTNTVFYLGRMISGRENADQISGPLGMAQIAGGLAKQTADASKDLPTLALNSLLNILSLVANISVGIGFLNLLPVPVLDGGHLLFYAYEAVARRPLAAKVQAAGYRLGLALVLGLMLFATWNDLQRLRVFNFVGGLFS